MPALRNRLGLLFHRIMIFLAILGPGLITASGDNDAPRKQKNASRKREAFSKIT